MDPLRYTYRDEYSEKCNNSYTSSVENDKSFKSYGNYQNSFVSEMNKIREEKFILGERNFSSENSSTESLLNKSALNQDLEKVKDNPAWLKHSLLTIKDSSLVRGESMEKRKLSKDNYQVNCDICVLKEPKKYTLYRDYVTSIKNCTCDDTKPLSNFSLDNVESECTEEKSRKLSKKSRKNKARHRSKHTKDSVTQYQADNVIHFANYFSFDKNQSKYYKVKNKKDYKETCATQEVITRPSTEQDPLLQTHSTFYLQNNETLINSITPKNNEHYLSKTYSGNTCMEIYQKNNPNNITGIKLRKDCNVNQLIYNNPQELSPKEILKIKEIKKTYPNLQIENNPLLIKPFDVNVKKISPEPIADIKQLTILEKRIKHELSESKMKGSSIKVEVPVVFDFINHGRQFTIATQTTNVCKHQYVLRESATDSIMSFSSSEDYCCIESDDEYN